MEKVGLYNIEKLREARERLTGKIDEIAKDITNADNPEEVGNKLINTLDKYELIYLTLLMEIVQKTNPFIGALLTMLTGIDIDNQSEMLKYLAKALKTEDVVILAKVFCGRE